MFVFVCCRNQLWFGTCMLHLQKPWSWAYALVHAEPSSYWLLLLRLLLLLPCLPAGVALQRMGYGCMTVGIRIRAALCNAVCKKCFNMATINQDMASDAVSFIASDISKIFDGCLEIHYLWTAPIEAGAILTILAVLVRVYALPGWGVICIVMPMQYLFGWMIIKNKIKNSKNTQERGGIIQEILPAMKLVKYYAW
jgi:hypothetical protein